MRITKVSPVSGKEHTREIDVTQEQIDDWKGGKLIQHAMPDVPAPEREFIQSGTTPEEWEQLWKDD